MKIMHFIHGLNTGGAETLVKNYMLNFDKNKNEIVLLCLVHFPDSPYEKNLLDNGIKVIWADDYSIFGRSANIFGRLFRHFARYVIVRKIIRKESPDILHTHLTVNRFVKFAKPKMGTRIFYTVHNEPNMLWSYDKKDGKKDLKATRWLLRKYGIKFIVLHKEMQIKINKIFNVNNAIVLNNGIDVSDYKAVKNKRKIRNNLGIPEDAFVVGNIGRFAQQKNHSFLVDIFAEIAIKNKKAFLLMVGEGNEKDNIIRKMHTRGLNGRYMILSNRDDIPDLLSAMDIFVFPSLWEGLGIALIEAQEAHLPCFISDAVPKHAVISNLTTRLSFEVGPRKWAEVIENYQMPKRIAIDDAEWDIKDITKKLEKIYMSSVVERVKN